ncbi:hypothetical protein QBC39DRAFT_421183 [Podospora conica]|nr:hypothetical protein QBC39DRAFT_421183 [Schizothecium conicum]
MPKPQAPILEKKLRKFHLPEKRWDLWGIIYDLHYNMAFSGHPELAREILETFLASLPQGQVYHPHYNHPLLSIWTHLPSSKPTNLPPNWPSEPCHLRRASADPDRDIFNPAFHTYFIMHAGTPRKPLTADDIIDLDAIDPHSWPNSTNPRHVAACARVLCRVPPGGVPPREAMEESFNAMDRVWDLLLPQERDPKSGLPPLVYDEVYPSSRYLSFAIGLGRTDKATLMFQRLADVWWVGPVPSDGAGYFHDWAELYELCLRDGGWLDYITREDAEACVELVRGELTAAEPVHVAPPPPPSPRCGGKRKFETELVTDVEDLHISSASGAEGHTAVEDEAELVAAVEDLHISSASGAEGGVTLQELMGLDWRELLRRFSEAAFTVHRKEYRELENPPRSAEEILLPPITQAALAEVEGKLGPLPADLRGMVVVANGFRGAGAAFGGGFPGVEEFEVGPCDDDWSWFGVNEEPSLEAKVAPVWVKYGGAEVSDESMDYCHVVCPTETWRKLVGDAHYTAGDYKVTYRPHWSVDDESYTSVREWIATETMEMEQMIAKGSWEGMDSDEDEDEEEEGDDE